MARLTIELGCLCAAAAHEHLLLLLLVLDGLLIDSGGCKASKHNVCRAEDSLRAATSRKLGWIGRHLATGLTMSAVAVLTYAVRPECIGNHATIDWATCKCRSLTLCCWAFSCGQSCSDLTFLFLLGRMAVLLSQLIVVNFGEGAHWSISFLLGLLCGCCVRTQETTQILWCSPWSSVARRSSLSSHILLVTTQFAFLYSILQLLSAP